jgi:hypothetical protein
MRKLFVAAALLGGMAYLGSTPAQQPDPELGKKMRQAGQIMRDHPVLVVNNPGVQKELKLDDDQVAAVKEKVKPPAGLTFGFGGAGGFGKGGGKGGGSAEAKERRAKQTEKMQALKDVPDDKMEEKVHEIYKEELEGPTKELDKILKPEQHARLKQIARQQGGPRAYLKTENAKDLSLTDEQKTKLREIATEHEKDTMELFRGGGFGKGGLPAETREKMEALNKEAAEKAVNVLTADQKSKWRELTGEPYTLRFEPRPKKDD